jgi:ribonuclease HI
MSGKSLALLLAYLREADPSADPLDLDAAARSDLADWLDTRLGSESPTPREAVPIPRRAQQDSVELFTDGASRGNPGPAALGLVILHGGEELYSRGAALGRLTNNQAEYEALIAGLGDVRRLGFARVEISMDSELIVRQIQGRYKVKNAALKPLYERARLKLAEFSDWSIRHIPRSENKAADALANKALDSL